MRADNRLNKSLEEAFINNDTQYNFGGWAPQKLFPRNFWVAGSIFLENDPTYYPNVLSYSPDGINWYGGQGANDKMLATFDITWSGEKWIAVGQRGNIGLGKQPNTILYSVDGINWEGSNNSLSVFSGGCRSVYWGGDMFVAGGNPPAKLAYSYDGITWSASTNGLSIFTGSSQVYDVIFNGEYWAAGGGSSPRIAFSNDGITWTGSSVPMVSRVVSLAYGNNLWLAGDYSNIFYSSDRINWSGSNANTLCSTLFLTTEYNGAIFVSAGRDITDPSYWNLIYSYDGITWSGANNTIFSVVFNIAWNGSKWIAAGIPPTAPYDYSLASSPDGINWTAISGTTSVVGYEGLAIAAQPAPNLYPPRY